jgi:trimeric autotransporter adhesin
MFNSSCSPVITGCVFRGNTRNYGSGITNQTASPEISNCLFIENVTTSSCGVLYNYSSSAPVVTNCTFANNTVLPDGVIVNNEGSMTMTNSIVWGNNYNTITNMNGGYAVVTYTDIQGGYAGTGNININPMFTNTAVDDYHLQPGSQCIDVGNDSAVPESVIGDMDGTTRIIDGNCDAAARVDMGCYEFSHKWSGDLNDDCRVNMPDIAVLSNYWKTNSAQADIAPGYGDGFVDIFDLAKIAANWLVDL